MKSIELIRELSIPIIIKQSITAHFVIPKIIKKYQKLRRCIDVLQVTNKSK